MPDLNDMVIFAGVVDAGSFSGAARVMAASTSRVSKSVARLERALGARLLNRSTRRLSLTEAGAAFYPHCRRIAQEATQARHVVNAHQSSARGVLRLSAPPLFGRRQLAPVLPAFLERFPEVRIDLALADHAVDLVQSGLDLAISIARDPPPGLVARRIGRAPRVLCAAPCYLRRRGAPGSAGELAQHSCLTRAEGHWRLRGPHGDMQVAVAGALCVDDEEAIWRAARGGLGIALLPRFVVDRDLRAGRLAAVLGNHTPDEEGVYALRRPGASVAPKVRVFVEYLSTRFLLPDQTHPHLESGKWKSAIGHTASASRAPMAA